MNALSLSTRWLQDHKHLQTMTRWQVNLGVRSRPWAYGLAEKLRQKKAQVARFLKLGIEVEQ
ncbi:MAG: hypothetical protein A3I63_08445 [Betaproteobacteria bacterium RIFCSPLOWO2_02_FULL_66_14]|nr:MAG: hypothetical protein A3I63_08445 [Betaproteobacteria bacterium RIFCSPLOWO2_02_FULL_66_14]